MSHFMNPQTYYQKLKAPIQKKLVDDRGLGTVEIVLIIAILIAIALIFRKQISAFANDLMERVFDHSLLDEVSYDFN